MKKKLLAALLTAVFIVSIVSFTVSASFSATHSQTLAKVSQTMQQRQQRWSRDRTPPTVEILSPKMDERVNGTITISASATDNVGVKTVEYSIDSGTWTTMEPVGDSIYTGEWNTASVYDGEHTITVRAKDARNNVGEDSITVTTANGITPPPPTIEYELFIEIDYMTGHEPTQAVLDYVHTYYLERGINVTFYVDDVVTVDSSVSDTDFWAIEAAYNDLGDDKYTGQLANFVSKWKWVLFGTTVEGYPNVVGYTYVVIARIGRTYDLLAGNYIFIADETADKWAVGKGVEPYGAEAVVLMHEMGHSIGIAVLSRLGAEVYDSDTYSVMSYLNVNNAGLYWAWYYSDKYWATRNMEYYAI